VAATLKAAANPQAESPNVVIETLDEDRRDRIKDAIAGYAEVFAGPMKRGKAALQAMSEDEWQKAIDDQEAREDD
jgi:hypothetical protein